MWSLVTSIYYYSAKEKRRDSLSFCVVLGSLAFDGRRQRPVPRFTRCCLSRDGLTEVNYWNVATTQETKSTICTQATRVYMVDGLSNCVTVTSSNPVSLRSSTLPVRTHIQYSVLKYGCMYRLHLIYSSFGGYLRTSKYNLYRNSVLHPNPERQVHLNL